MVQIGMPAPDFTVQDETGELRSLADFRGKTVVLWFYPKADTPGCTAEGCGFRDLTSEFATRDVQILGVSFDSTSDNRAFKEKYRLPFPLLCDTERMLGLAYGACDSPAAKHPRRISVVIDGEGRVVRVYDPVDARTHPQTVLADLQRDS